MKLTLISEINKRTAVLIVPEDESPDMLQRLRGISGVSFSEKAGKTGLIRHKVSHELIADYDEQGRLVLKPGYRIKDEQGKPVFIAQDDPGYARMNDRWLWANNTYIMLEQIPSECLSYRTEAEHPQCRSSGSRPNKTDSRVKVPQR